MGRTIHLCMAAMTALLGLASCAAPSGTADLEKRFDRFDQWYRNAGEQRKDRQAVAAKVDGIFKGVDFARVDAGGLVVIARVASFSPGLEQKVGARADELAADPGPEGAVAAQVRFDLAFRRGNDALKAAILETIRHPGFGEAVKQGRVADTFELLDDVPDEVLIELVDDVVALAGYFKPGLSPPMYLAGAYYVAVLIELGDHVDAQARESLRVFIRDQLQAAAQTAEPGSRPLMEALAAFLDGALARGTLVGYPAPPLHLEWSAGGPGIGGLSDLRGKVVVLEFWNAGCSRCRASLPKIRELQARYEGYDVAILGVTSLLGDTKDDPAREHQLMLQFMERHQITWTVAFSRESVFNPDYGVRGVPHIAIIDAEGRVRRIEGPHFAAATLAEESAKIDALLAEAGLPAPPPVAGPDPGR